MVAGNYDVRHAWLGFSRGPESNSLYWVSNFYGTEKNSWGNGKLNTGLSSPYDGAHYCKRGSDSAAK